MVSRALDLLALAAVLGGLVLLFHDLDRNGSTWDERVDFRIARNFVEQGSIVQDKSDPSQTRLPHIIGALSIAALGENLWAFKLPFALTGVLSGLVLFAFVAARHDARTALYCLAFYLTNPWVLASSRTAATAGDILVVLTTFAWLWVAILVFGGREAPRHPLAKTVCLGLLTGIAIGAKLTNAVLFPAGLALVAVRRKSLTHLIVFALLASFAAVAIHPLLITHTSSTIGATTLAFGATPLALEGVSTRAASEVERIILAVEPMEVENTPKLRYLYSLLVGKLTLPFLLFVVVGIVAGLFEVARTRRLDPHFLGALAFVLVPCALLIWKYKQNTSYYLPLLLPAISIAAIPLARGLRSALPWRRLVVALAWLAIVGYQLWLDTNLAPDFLQAGRRLGPAAQGQMAGPATNHCQGTPVLIETLNRLRQHGERFDTVYVLETCLPVITNDVTFGPIAPDGFRFVRYSLVLPPRDEHVFVVHEVIRLDEYGMPDHTERMRWLDWAKHGCTWLNADAPLDRFRIYRCPARE